MKSPATFQQRGKFWKVLGEEASATGRDWRFSVDLWVGHSFADECLGDFRVGKSLPGLGEFKPLSFRLFVLSPLSAFLTFGCSRVVLVVNVSHSNSSLQANTPFSLRID